MPPRPGPGPVVTTAGSRCRAGGRRACRRAIRSRRNASSHGGWLARFGPATSEDLRWWTGWNTTTTLRALERLEIEEVDLHGQTGIDLARAAGELAEDAPDNATATLLPALDPTPMGWKNRDWFLGIDSSLVFDRAGNIGPTLWWDGEIVGSWAVATNGDLRTTVVVDRDAQARAAIELAASQLHAQLNGAVVTPAIRTPARASAHHRRQLIHRTSTHAQAPTRLLHRIVRPQVDAHHRTDSHARHMSATWEAR